MRNACAALACLLVAGCDANLGDGADETDASSVPVEIDAAVETADATPPPDAAPGTPDATPSPDARACVEGDAQLTDPATGTCYIYLASQVSWTDAQTGCLALGGHLAALNTPVENLVVSPLAGPQDLWICGTDQASEGLWIWINGEPMAYTTWRNGEPNNAGENGANGENCMVLEGNDTGLWDDRTCTNTQGYICERPQ